MMRVEKQERIVLFNFSFTDQKEGHEKLMARRLLVSSAALMFALSTTTYPQSRKSIESLPNC